MRGHTLSRPSAYQNGYIRGVSSELDLSQRLERGDDGWLWSDLSSDGGDWNGAASTILCHNFTPICSLADGANGSGVNRKDG